jgi:hypothetical protein
VGYASIVDGPYSGLADFINPTILVLRSVIRRDHRVDRLRVAECLGEKEVVLDVSDGGLGASRDQRLQAFFRSANGADSRLTLKQLLGHSPARVASRAHHGDHASLPTDESQTQSFKDQSLVI